MNSIKTENSAELLLYGEIANESWWGDEVTPKDFANDLYALGDIEELHVRINSGGGDVFAGQAIYSLLKSHKAKVIVHIDGLAASIATVIAMAGDEIIMPKNSLMMIHNPFSWTSGDANDFRHMADTLDAIRDSIINTYLTRVSMSKEDLIAKMDDDWWLTAEEALELGFIDTFDETTNIVASVYNDKFVMNGIELDVKNYKNVPWKGVKEMENEPTNKLQTGVVNMENGSTPVMFAEGLKVMNSVQDLQTMHPQIYNDLHKSAYDDGVKNERERIKNLKELDTPLTSEIVKNAIESGKTAQDIAIECFNLAKNTQGEPSKKPAIQDFYDDAHQIADVSNEGDTGNVSNQQNELVQNMIKVGNKLRGR